MFYFQTQKQLEDFLASINHDYRAYGGGLWRMGVNDTEILAYLNKEQLKISRRTCLPRHPLNCSVSSPRYTLHEIKARGELVSLGRHCSAKMK